MLANKLLGVSSTPPTDFYYNYVTMLLHGNGTNGGNNNTFIDSSINNLSVSRFGTTTQGSLSPYGNLWSNNFNGTTDYLTTPDSVNFDFGTGNFTVEAWVYPTSLAAASGGSIASGLGPTNGDWMFAMETANIRWGRNQVAWDLISTGFTPTLNNWIHVAVSRNGTTLRLFANGTQVASSTNSQSYNISATLAIGARQLTAGASTPGEFWAGYISNLRIVKGTAVYTSNFTPSKTPLTAIAGTSLLTCQSNRFLDSSSNNAAISNNGNVYVNKFSPFIPTSVYDPAVIGGSIYFGGTGNYLSLANNSVLNLDTGDFTIECFVFPVGGSSSYPRLLAKGTALQAGSWALALDYIGLTAAFEYGATPSYISTSGINKNTWNHIAVVRSGTTVTLYVNGIAGGTGTVTNNFTNTNVLYINRANANADYVEGNISNPRILKGTALYTSNFTPPTAPLLPITNTSLLLSGTNAAIFDSAADSNLATVSSVQISTSVKQFGTGSISFFSTGGRLARPYDPMFDVVTQTFTFEAWVYPTIANTTGTRIFSTGGGGVAWNNTTGIQILIQTESGTSSGGVLNLQISNNTATPISVSTTDIVPINQWTFISVSVIGSTAYLAVNGNVVSGSVSGRARPSSNPTSNLGLIPGETIGSTAYRGYMDEVRFTTGIARYVSNYTPPLAPFPDQ